MTSTGAKSPKEPRDRSVRLWLFAALGALALHLGGVALAVSHLQTDEPDEELGAAGMEIGLELAAPHAPPSDLPPGPDADASAASAAAVEQKEVLKQTELPKDTPTETDNPDRVVSPDNTKMPQKDDPTPAQAQTTASTESVAAEATAMPSSDTATQSDRSTTLAQGTGESRQRMRTTWQKELVAHLDRHKRYPSDRLQKSAEIVVGFELDRVGHVLSTRIVKSSGDPSFDEAALSMLRRSDPVPQPPPLVADEGLNFTLPVIFRVKGKS